MDESAVRSRTQYGILLSTPRKNFKDKKTAEEKKQIGRYRWRFLIARYRSFDQV
jgi:hypothetical protein